MRDPVPAIAESEATGSIAEIFADIRSVYRVGVVNLIWRHLATIPRGLPWVWATARPLCADGTVGREATEASQPTLHRALKDWGFEPLPLPFVAYGPFGGAFHYATLDTRRRGALEDYF
jgi:hypothetical protein